MNTPTDPHNHLLFGVRRSVRYHQRRQHHYESFHQWVIFVGLLFGSATLGLFATEFAAGWPLVWKLLPAAVVSLLSALDLVLGSQRKATGHHDLARDFIALEIQMELAGPHPEPATLAKLTAERLSIEAREPPVLRVLDTLCHNELAHAMGHDGAAQVPLSWYQRLFAGWFDLRQSRLYPRAER